MDTLIRGIKQMSTGLKFTVEKQISSHRPYVLSNGCYKEKEVSVLKFKGPYAPKIADSLPILKNLTDAALARHINSQSTGGSVYVLVERLLPLDQSLPAKYPEFFAFSLHKIKACVVRVQKEHNLELGSFDSDQISEGDLYLDANGLIVLAGFELKFIKDPRDKSHTRAMDQLEKSVKHSGPIEESIFCKLERDIDRYSAMTASEQALFQDLVKSNLKKIPEPYKQRLLGRFVEFLNANSKKENREEEREKKIRTVKAALGLKTDPGDTIATLFRILDTDVRLFLLKALRSTKGLAITPAVVKSVFTEFHLGLVCNDDTLKLESIATTGHLVDLMDKKHRGKILATFQGMLKKGKGAEKDKISQVCLDKMDAFADTNAELFYPIVVDMVVDNDRNVKTRGIMILDSLYLFIDAKFTALQVIPLVAKQLLYEEVQEKCFVLLEKLLAHLRTQGKQLKAGSAWKVSGIKGILSGPSPAIKVTRKAKPEPPKQEEDLWDEDEW